MKIGILGGGQLSKMLALAGIPLGFQFVFYFPACEHSLQCLGEIIHGDYEDFDAITEFAQQVDVITYENENIPTATVEKLKERKPVYPDERALAVSQDRLVEKNFFESVGVPTNRFMQVDQYSDFEAAAKEFGYPIILKKRRLGYDGKGQFKFDNEAAAKQAPESAFQNAIAEEFVKFDREVSLVMARNQHGAACYDICENTHHNGILKKTQNSKNDSIFNLAHEYVTKIVESLNYIGVLAVEFFQVGDTLLANEMAPRVHNSGHWTIDACTTSQFENHLRAISGLPLGATTSFADATMLNILSEMPDIAELLETDGLCLHDYKKAPRKGRKLGHITILGESTIDK